MKCPYKSIMCYQVDTSGSQITSCKDCPESKRQTKNLFTLYNFSLAIITIYASLLIIMSYLLAVGYSIFIIIKGEAIGFFYLYCLAIILFWVIKDSNHSNTSKNGKK